MVPATAHAAASAGTDLGPSVEASISGSASARQAPSVLTAGNNFRGPSFCGSVENRNGLVNCTAVNAGTGHSSSGTIASATVLASANPRPISPNACTLYPPPDSESDAPPDTTLPNDSHSGNPQSEGNHQAGLPNKRDGEKESEDKKGRRTPEERRARRAAKAERKAKREATREKRRKRSEEKRVNQAC